MRQIWFGWVTPILLSVFDDYYLDRLEQNFTNHFRTSARYNENSLLRSILWNHRGALMLSGLLKLFAELFAVQSVKTMRAAALELGKLIKTESQSLHLFMQLTMTLLIIEIANTFSLNHQELMMNKIGLACSRSLSKTCYAKLLTNSGRINDGKLTNTMTIDCVRVENMFSNFHYLWSAPIQCLLIFWSLYQLIGWSSIVGISIMIFYMPVQLLNTFVLKNLRKKSLSRSDERLKLTKMILSSIKLVKSMMLESWFVRIVSSARISEESSLRFYHLTRCLASSLNFLFMVSATSGTIIYMMFSKNNFDTATIVSVITLFKLLRVRLNMIPLSMNAFSDGLVSLQRIHHFLTDSFDGEPTEPIEVEVNQSGYSITFINRHFSIKMGSIVTIEGSSGSGKSLLLRGLVKEYSKFTTVGFCSQVPWILSKSVKENITLEDQVDEKRYAMALELVHLKADLKSFAESDNFIVEEDGSNISGGQRQRMCLARIIYSDSKIWLIDDVFSALDGNTAEAVLEDCIKRKPEDVTVFIVGKYDFADTSIKLDDRSSFVLRSSSLSVNTDILQKDEQNRRKYVIDQPKKEVSRRGKLDSNLVRKWIWLNGGPFFILAALTLLVGINQCRIGSEVIAAKGQVNKDTLSTYLLYGAGQIALPFALTALISLRGLRSSSKIHERTISRLVSAPLLKHISTPSSSILNRLGKDQESLDNGLIISSAALLVMSGVLFFTAFNIVKMRPNLMIIPVMVVLLGYWAISRIYRRSMREAKRSEASSRSPIIGAVMETIRGIDHIKGFRMEDNFSCRVNRLIDKNCAIKFFLATSQVWFTLRVEILGALLTFAVAWISLYTRLDPGIASLVLSYSSSLSGLTMWTIRQLSHTESSLIALERISDLSEDFKSDYSHEDGIVVEKRSVAPAIVIKDVSASFNGTPFLRNVSVEFGAGTKTCIVGRTGSGKSSLLMTIASLYEIESGQILIDGQDSEKLSNVDLRSMIGYCLQESIIFEGLSVRDNLDPLGTMADSQIWPVLKSLHVSIKSLDEIMSSTWPACVKESVCLARTLLRSCPAILLDEPLASLDSDSFSSILNDQNFKSLIDGKTLVIITHRQELVDFCEKSVVLSHGQVRL